MRSTILMVACVAVLATLTLAEQRDLGDSAQEKLQLMRQLIQLLRIREEELKEVKTAEKMMMKSKMDMSNDETRMADQMPTQEEGLTSMPSIVEETTMMPSD